MHEESRVPRIAFVSTSVAPYCIPARQKIDEDARIKARHFFAARIEPGREWRIEKIPDTFEIVRGAVLRFRKRFIYLPTGLPAALKRFSPDVIIGEQLGSLLIFTLIYAKLANIPVLLRWEGTWHTEKRFSKGARGWLRRRLISCVSG